MIQRTIVYLMAAEDPPATGGGTRTAPNITWSPDPGLQSFCSKLAFFVGAAWLLYLLIQFASPKRRAVGGGGFKLISVIAAVFSVVILMDLELIPTIVNGLLDLSWWLFGLLGIV